MKISLLENGIDSLGKGYLSLNSYLDSKSKSKKDKIYLLKDAIMNIHHGIEILMKCILKNESEYLIFSQIDDNVLQAYTNKHQKKLNSVFETEQKNKLRTVTYIEALKRIKAICNHKFSSNLEDKIKLLNDFRNHIIHSEVSFNENEIIKLFNDFINEIDIYFFTAIGSNYKTLSGYSELIEKIEEYNQLLDKKNLKLKKVVLKNLLATFTQIKIGIGSNDVTIINDIDKAIIVLNNFIKKGFELGTDLYNGYCSGHISKIAKIDSMHISLFAKDIDSEYIFKFKSLVIYLPEVTNRVSPIFIFEADDDDQSIKEFSKSLFTDNYNRKVVEGLYFYEDERYTFEKREISEFHSQIEDDSIVPAYHNVYKFMSTTIFCFLNIKGLEFGKFDLLVNKCMNYTGKQLELELKKSIKTNKNTSK